jgi:hypothetical protein
MMERGRWRSWLYVNLFRFQRRLDSHFVFLACSGELGAGSGSTCHSDLTSSAQDLYHAPKRTKNFSTAGQCFGSCSIFALLSLIWAPAWSFCSWVLNLDRLSRWAWPVLACPRVCRAGQRRQDPIFGWSWSCYWALTNGLSFSSLYKMHVR